MTGPDPKDTPTPTPGSVVEAADRERQAREREAGKKRAADMNEAKKLERLILAAHNELAKRGEHAGAYEIAEFLVANGCRFRGGDRVVVPEHWPRFGLTEVVRPEEP